MVDIRKESENDISEVERRGRLTIKIIKCTCLRSFVKKTEFVARAQECNHHFIILSLWKNNIRFTKGFTRAHCCLYSETARTIVDLYKI
jgi:hypothetical protein